MGSQGDQNFIYDSSAFIDLILTELLFLRLSYSKIGGTSGHTCQPSWISMMCINLKPT